MAITSGGEHESGSFSDINVTPLTDVLLVLLIIFLITGSSITAPSHESVLPEVVTKEKAEDANIVIDVTPDGATYVGNEKCDRDKLQPYLKALGKQKQTDRVIINADGKTAYKWVVIAMDAARKAGLINIALATDHKESAKDSEGDVGGKVKVTK